MRTKTNRFDRGTAILPESARKIGFKPIAAAALLASLLLLGGCVRFGPQADEMEKTASRSAETNLQEENSPANSADPEESAVTPEKETDSDNETRTEQKGEPDSKDRSDAQADDTAGSGEKGAKASAAKDKLEIEATINRDDSQSMVTVELQLLPQGYSLVSLSWEPAVEDPSNRTDVSSQAGQPISGSAAANGTSVQEQTGSGSPSSSAESERVTSTYHDAVLAGQAGSKGFFIDQDGQRIGYRYTEQQRGRSGTLRLDFRDSDGATVTWDEAVVLGTANSPDDETNQEGG
ncbi:hypothetical protein CDO73_18795 [Saccharibacillus sp. O23]|uniref:hypothetical protein n=1 Tax=Saccharibacillus sp. O23 TaxID=2009338 RepID=UPI000B4E3457|nr:hypothetical protein [Saccharibacillus sp. O23]OWR28325.1 hypothetical protein CDO73_18795 [Saccharibacillus sp. O23]